MYVENYSPPKNLVCILEKKIHGMIELIRNFHSVLFQTTHISAQRNSDVIALLHTQRTGNGVPFSPRPDTTIYCDETF